MKDEQLTVRTDSSSIDFPITLDPTDNPIVSISCHSDHADHGDFGNGHNDHQDQNEYHNGHSDMLDC